MLSGASCSPSPCNCSPSTMNEASYNPSKCVCVIVIVYDVISKRCLIVLSISKGKKNDMWGTIDTNLETMARYIYLP